MSHKRKSFMVQVLFVLSLFFFTPVVNAEEPVGEQADVTELSQSVGENSQADFEKEDIPAEDSLTKSDEEQTTKEKPVEDLNSSDRNTTYENHKNKDDSIKDDLVDEAEAAEDLVVKDETSEGFQPSEEGDISKEPTLPEEDSKKNEDDKPNSENTPLEDEDTKEVDPEPTEEKADKASNPEEALVQDTEEAENPDVERGVEETPDQEEADKTQKETEKPVEQNTDNSDNKSKVRTFSASAPIQSISTESDRSYAVPMNYTTTIVNSGYTIDTKPWGESGYESAGVGTSSDYLGETVNVGYESTSGSYAEISWNNNYLGWIDKRAFQGNRVYTYTTKILYPDYSVDSEPWGREGYEKIGSAEDYLNQNVQVVMKNDNKNYSLTVLNGHELGWIDNKALSSEQDHYNAFITRSGYSIDTRPWGRDGYEFVTTTDNQFGDYVEVIGSNSNGNYAYLINSQTQEDLGWTDKRALTVPENVYTGRILYPNYTVGTQAEVESGNQGSGNDTSYDHLGKIVSIIDESKSGTYGFVVDGNQGLGWLNKEAMIIDEPTNLTYVLFPNYTIDNLPWGEAGYQSAGNGTSSDYLNQQVNIIARADRAYSFITDLNGESLGWIDNRALSINQPNELATILYPGYTLDTHPWGVQGYAIANVSTSADHFNKNVLAISESTDGNYSFVVEIDGTPLGWIDQKAFGVLVPVSEENGVIENNGYSIDSQPWGTPGYEKVAMSNDYLNHRVDILGEDTKGSYYLIGLNSGILGWIDQKAMDSLALIYIDPGHGGSDPGASHGGVQEKDLNLAVGLRLADLLESTGNYDVVLSRDADYFVSLQGRTNEANALDADLFVSIHFNSMGGSGAARGIETFIHHTLDNAAKFGQETNRNNFRTDRPRIRESLEAADAIHKELIQDTGLRDRGVKGNNFHVLRNTDMPAVLLELGFLDNYSERNHVNRTSYFDTSARAIKDGIDAYFKFA